jgi:hypothetical protein
MYTLQGKPDQHATRFSHSVHVWPSTICNSCSPRIATFHKVNNSDGQSHCSREKMLPTQFIARWLTNPWVHTQFLSQASHWNSGGKATLCWRQTTKLTGPIYQHAIDTFNTCSQGSTHRSLTDTGGGYNLGGAGSPHTTPRLSQLAVSTFHLKALPDLGLSIQ